ncbi:MAG: uroporphyrinogen-III C-methyltransferase [Salinisphaera sp.]|nr:uroporphyrinogen-III C-methyltransferase [Salinisphaera sp.]
MSEDKAQDSPADPRPAEPPQDNLPTQSGDANPRAPGSGRGLLAAVLIVLVLVALTASGYAVYLAYHLQASQVETATQQQALSAEIDTLRNELGRTSVALADQRQISEAIQATLERFAQRERMNNSDWAMAEVEQLAILAMHRLTLGHDVASSRAALEAAARRVKDIHNPGLVPVRKQLTSDINALRAVPEVDIAGIALYLADLITRAEQLPLASDSLNREQPVGSGAADAPVSDWRGVLAAIWGELRQLVVIQREDAPPAELLAPDERYYLYQNLRVELANARNAALRRDTRNLRVSIELIQDWLARYFNTDAEAVANIQDSLGKMATVDLSPELPDISGSLEAVRAWQQRQADEAVE